MWLKIREVVFSSYNNTRQRQVFYGYLNHNRLLVRQSINYKTRMFYSAGPRSYTCTWSISFSTSTFFFIGEERIFSICIIENNIIYRKLKHHYQAWFFVAFSHFLSLGWSMMGHQNATMELMRFQDQNKRADSEKALRNLTRKRTLAASGSSS